MKTLNFLFTVMFIVLFSGFASGQTAKGNFIAGTGTDLGFSSSSYKTKSDNGSSDNGNSSNFSLTPTAGYFVAQNLAAGIGLSLSFGSSKSENFKLTDNSYAVIPFIRYYVGKEKMKPFLHGAYGFGGGKVKTESGSISVSDYSYSSSSYEIDGGLAYFLTAHVSVDMKLGFNSNTIKQKQDNPDNIRNIDSHFNAGIGVNFIFL